MILRCIKAGENQADWKTRLYSSSSDTGKNVNDWPWLDLIICFYSDGKNSLTKNHPAFLVVYMVIEVISFFADWLFCFHYFDSGD